MGAYGCAIIAQEKYNDEITATEPAVELATSVKGGLHA
ncbi:hypothetical protein HSISB1_2068 [Streptococcus sp. HSISB1]|nr:hypothetical protein HSISB1_2068 [Streptococcus sp. HSISB1]